MCAHSVNNERGKRRSMQKQNDKDTSKTSGFCAVQVVEKQSLHCLSSDHSVRKEWINFICNEVSDRISKSLVLCSLHFSTDSLTNKTQFDVGFSEIFKLKDDAVPTILDPNVMSQHTSMRNCFYNAVTFALSVITDRLICTEYFSIFNLNPSSVHV